MKVCAWENDIKSSYFLLFLRDTPAENVTFVWRNGNRCDVLPMKSLQSYFSYTT